MNRPLAASEAEPFRPPAVWATRRVDGTVSGNPGGKLGPDVVLNQVEVIGQKLHHVDIGKQGQAVAVRGARVSTSMLAFQRMPTIGLGGRPRIRIVSLSCRARPHPKGSRRVPLGELPKLLVGEFTFAQGR